MANMSGHRFVGDKTKKVVIGENVLNISGQQGFGKTLALLVTVIITGTLLVINKVRKSSKIKNVN